ncbi:MAG: hypothetical protein WAN87_07700, partial [Thermoplasmata archaeon]
MPRIRSIAVTLALALIVLFAIPTCLAPIAAAETGLVLAGSSGSALAITLALKASPIDLNASFWGTTISAGP